MKHIPGWALLFFLAACASKPAPLSPEDEQRLAHARELTQRFIIADGHVDLPERLKGQQFTADSIQSVVHSKTGEFDYERARTGGLTAPFMSIFIPASYQKHSDFGKGLADSLIGYVETITKLLPEKFAPARSPKDVEANFVAGKISLPMGMENGAPIGTEIKNVKYFFDRGIRYITLTHSKNNQICDSSGDTAKWNGLSPFGRQVVKEMNRVGIMVDISHVDDSTFYQVMKLSKAPCIASHSSCRYFAPSVRRDMTDDMIKKIKDNDGLIAVNFYTAFIDSATANYQRKSQAEIKKLQAELHVKGGDPKAKEIEERYKKDHPKPTVDIEVVVDHIDHIAKLIGVDHVAFGSDFDGVDGMLPIGLESPAKYPQLIERLLKRGYTDEDIEKICYKNFFRVWKRVEEVAAQP